MSTLVAGPSTPVDRTLIRTPDQRLRVFVSSTLEELRPERAAVRRAIEGLRLVPVMFELGARPYPPRALYRSYPEQSDIFVGVYWQRYGWVAPDIDVSSARGEMSPHSRARYLRMAVRAPRAPRGEHRGVRGGGGRRPGNG